MCSVMFKHLFVLEIYKFINICKWYQILRLYKSNKETKQTEKKYHISWRIKYQEEKPLFFFSELLIPKKYEIGVISKFKSKYSAYLATCFEEYFFFIQKHCKFVLWFLNETGKSTFQFS